MDIKQSKFIKSLVHLKDRPEPLLPEIACVGRSNVGKSSLINTLTNRKKLVQVSKTPGKTKLINYFLINEQFYLVDLPGYGFAKVSHAEKNSWKKMIERYLTNNEMLKLVLILTDSRIGPQKSDLQMIEYLYHSQIPYTVIATKTDKLSKNSLLKNIKKYYKANPIISNSFIPFSSVTKEGRAEVLKLFYSFLK